MTAHFEFLPNGWVSQESGWGDPCIVEAQKNKWPAFVSVLHSTQPLGTAHESEPGATENLTAHNTIMTFAYVLGRALGGKSDISMLDWGCGLGHYLALARTLYPEFAIEYHGIDHENLCHAAVYTPGGKFYGPDVPLLRCYDLVMASGSLSYVKNWKEKLKELAAAASPWFYFTRVYTVKGSSYVMVQHPQQFGYPDLVGWCLNRDEILAACKDNHLTLEREFYLEPGVEISGAPENPDLRGFLFRKIHA